MAKKEYLGKFEYDDLEDYSKAINALEDTAAELRVAMSGAFPDNNTPAPEIGMLYTIMHNLNDDTTVLLARIIALITKATERNVRERNG